MSSLVHRVTHDLRVAYELLLDAKRHKLRIADVVLAFQDSSRTPPAHGAPLKMTVSGGASPLSTDGMHHGETVLEDHLLNMK